MIVINNRYIIKSGKRKEFLEKLIASGTEEFFRSLPGNILYYYAVPIDESDSLYLNAVWEDEESFNEHKEYPATLTWRKLRDEYVIDKIPFSYGVKKEQR